MPLYRRAVARTFKNLMRQFPVVSILGPRQAGKTTLARAACPGARYWDLERPSDRARLEIDPETMLRDARPPVILDEAQRMPELFPVLRALVDEQRSPGRFVLLGSASPRLVRGISESLAGRVGFIELAPFTWNEIRGRERKIQRIWERGGFPAAWLARSAAAWFHWMESYLRTAIERDIGLLGHDLPAARLHRFARLLAHLHGGLWNASEVGSALGVTYHTTQGYVELLEQMFLVRLLPPWHANLGSRLVKRPRVYWRDPGILHFLLGLDQPGAIREHPKAGASWEGFVIEEIIRRERIERPASQPFFFRTHTGLECDLLLARGREIIPIEIKITAAPRIDDVNRLRAVMALLKARHGHLICRVRETARIGPITLWRAEDLLGAKRWPL